MSETAPAALVTESSGSAGEQPGPTLVFVHGLGVSSWYFDPLFRELADNVATVLVDLPGFGHAEEPERELRIGGQAEALVRTIREQGLTDVILVGHSMGAQVAVEAMARYPGLARALVLLTPVVPPSDRTHWRVIAQFARASLHETLAAAYRSVLTFLSTDPTWIAQHFTAMTHYPLEERIAKVPPSVPIVLLRGSHDNISSRAFLQLLQRSTRHRREGGICIIREVHGASHHVMGSHAHIVAATLVGLSGSG